jgi:hypothetical protein
LRRAIQPLKAEYSGAAPTCSAKIHSIVMRGLDPRIHHLCKIFAKKIDPRVNPRIKSGDAGDGGDELSSQRTSS